MTESHPRMRPLFLDDSEVAQTISGTWSISADGTMIHKESGIAINQLGIKDRAGDFSLDPRDIDVDLDDILGRGACGVVNRAIHRPTGILLAIKCVKVEDKDKRAQLMTDIQALIRVQNCRNLVHLYAAYLHKQSGRVHVALELMDLGSLQDWLRYIPKTGVEERIIGNICLQIAQGLAYLHAHRQVHRDVKPGNVLLNSHGEVKLSDFGISKLLDATSGVCDTFVGTVTYMSPERATGGAYSFPADVWSVGMILFQLSTGSFPFPTLVSFPVLFDYLCNKPEPRLVGPFSTDLAEAVERSLQRRPEKRATAAELVALPLCQRPASNAEVAAYFTDLRRS